MAQGTQGNLGLKLQQALDNADKQDRRRQQQIKNQMVRMDNMKLIINHLAQEVHKAEDTLYLKMESGEARSTAQIVADAVKAVNTDGK